jgi:sterol desaturase/sphingolipid hydroxylase (fatty acid hydroxylase superfamily)
MHAQSLAAPLLLVLAALALLEAVLYPRRRGAPFAWREGGASLLVGLGYGASRLLTGGLVALTLDFFWRHRAFTAPLERAWAWVALFLLVELCYYWAHRAMHEVRWFWAHHAVHHTPTQLTLSASYRIGWTAGLCGFYLFFAPAVWLGFPPQAVLGMFGLNLLYQVWLHTELVPKLGWLERVLNTPSHHRVHHASNPAYLDRNYGGVLVLFDRLFGTLAVEREDEPCRYGLTHPLPSHNPLVIAFHAWAALARDVARARSWRERWVHLAGRPAHSAALAARTGAREATGTAAPPAAGL